MSGLDAPPTYDHGSVELREAVWNAQHLLELCDHPKAAAWENRLRDMENEYVEAHVWREALETMQALDRGEARP